MGADQRVTRHFAPPGSGLDKTQLSVNNTLTKVKPTILEDYDKRFLEQMRMLMLEIRTNSPFFGILGTDIWIAGASDAVPTIGVSPKGVVVYNEKWLKSKTAGQIVALLVHEAMHPALDFWDRFKGCNFERANWAHDFVINATIEEGLCSLVIRRANGDVVPLKIEIAPGMLYDPNYKNMSGEEVYRILTDKITTRAAEIKAKTMEAMSDPAQRAAMERQRKIAQQMRQSVGEGGKLVGEKTREAIHNTSNASHEVAGGHQSFRDLHQDLLDGAQLEITHKDGSGTDRPANNPYEDKPKPQEQEPKNTDPQPGLPQEGEASNEGSDSLPSNEPGGEQGEPKPSSFEQAKEQLEDDLLEKFQDYVSKERERIGNEVDGTPDGSTRKENLENLRDEIDECIEDFVEKVTKPQQGQPEAGQEAPQQGEPSQDQGEPGNPQQSQQADGQPTPGGEMGSPDADGSGGQSTQSQGNGQGGQRSGGQPQMGGSAGTGPDDGAGEPGTEQSPSQGAGQNSSAGEPVSPHEARSAAQKALEQMVDQLGQSLSGKGGGMPGLDRQMASGDHMIDEGAMKQAMQEMSKELGQDGDNSMTGDVLIDCEDIPGNPFKGETPEETNERRKQTIQRAVLEQAKTGQGMGNLPAWLVKEFEGILHPPLKFTDKMKRYMGQFGRADQRSFNLPNRRNSFVKDTMIKPGVRKNSAKVYIMRDVSGSMMNASDLDSLRRSVGLVDRLANAQRMEVEVVLVDAEVTKVMNTREALKEVEKKRFEVVGQGGSDLTPAFEQVWKEMSTVNAGRGNPIIVFTDGDIKVPDMPPKNIRQQVLWVTNPGQKPPTTNWGEHIVMDDL